MGSVEYTDENMSDVFLPHIRPHIGNVYLYAAVERRGGSDRIWGW